MPIITGPRLDEMARQLREWYITTRDSLMKALEEGYPYGSVPLTPQEQVDRFMSMTPEDWQIMSAKLALRHRGKPNVQELVRKDIQDYITRMSRLGV